MHRVVFKIMGGFLLFLAAGVLITAGLALAGYLPRLSPAVSRQAFGLRIIITVALFAALGMGLLHLRKWAALGLSILALYPAFWSFWSAAHPTPPNADWLGYVFGFLLIVPSVLTVKYWNSLVWRKQM